MNNTHKIDITKNCNNLRQKYVDTTKNMCTLEQNIELLINSNTTPITLLM